MCGISGIIKKSLVNEQQIKAMTSIISHRGPDAEGFYFGRNFALGHRRLSIIDLSDAGKQPFEYQDNYVIVFNGEIYNYIELRSELKTIGYQFNTETDTEVILAAYDKWGTDSLNKFNGMWSFALFDKKKNTIFCSRDWFGVKPFYYATINEQFVFGSEIKQFTVIEGWKAKMNPQIVFDFLSAGKLDHTSETFFTGISQLPAASYLVFNLDNHTFEINRYYDLKKLINHSVSNFDEAKIQFKNLLTDSVRLRLRADVKVGTCLSGGLDSSSIVCLMNQILKEKGATEIQESVSSCSENKKFDEQEYIDEVIRHTQIINHKVFPSFSNLLESLDKIIWHQDEPFVSTSIFAQWNVFKTAHENGLIVMLDGQGADESLAGYLGFFYPFLSNLLWKGQFKTLADEIQSLKRKNKMSFTDVLRLIVAISVRNNKLRNLIKPKHAWLKHPTNVNTNMLNDNFSDDLKQFSISLLERLNLSALLHYEDRNSMAFSIERRVPFLDYRLVEFILNLPDNYKISKAKTKFVLRESLKTIVPDKILERTDKMAFVTPESVWFAQNRDFMEREITEAASKLSMFIDSDLFIRSFKKDISKNTTLDSIYWRIICLNRWFKIFNVSI